MNHVSVKANEYGFEGDGPELRLAKRADRLALPTLLSHVVNGLMELEK
jgi:hypothetical protein